MSINAQTVLIDDNFESYTVPNAPTNPGDGNANNWVFAATTNATSAFGSSPNGSGDNEQILRLQKTNDAATAARAARLFDSQNSGILQFDLKFRIHDFTGSATNTNVFDGFRLNSNSGSGNTAINWSLDDVHFTVIPEPATAALLLFGSFGCVLLRHSRRG